MTNDDQPASNLAAGAVGQLGRMFNSDICGYCGCNLPEVQDIAVCDSCDKEATDKNAQMKAEKEAERAERRQSAWERRAGEYGTGEASRLPFDKMRELLDEWNPSLRFGATILGHGLGKSWLLWLMLRKAWDAGREFEYRDATEMRGELLSMSRVGDQSSKVKALIKTPILAIDNFGFNKSTEAADELWHQIFEGRAKGQRPTIVVTPYQSGPLIDRFNDRVIGGSIVKRLGPEQSWVLDTVVDQLKKPTK